MLPKCNLKSRKFGFCIFSYDCKLTSAKGSCGCSPSYGVRRMSPVVCRALAYYILKFFWTTTGPNSIWYSLDGSLPNFLLWSCLISKINFSITIQHRLTVLGLIPLTPYSWSAEFVVMLWLVSHTLSPDIYFIFMVNWLCWIYVKFS